MYEMCRMTVDAFAVQAHSQTARTALTILLVLLGSLFRSQ